jgi:predicted O-methyltransferase YrrM
MKGKIREHEAFLKDIQGVDCIAEGLIEKWASESHSVSEHLLTLYSKVRELEPKVIIEVGFGRTSKLFAKVAIERQGLLYSCDRNDFEYTFSDKERKHTRFVHGLSDVLWEKLKKEQVQVDFAFLDHFSGSGLSLRFCASEFLKCGQLMRKDGVVCVHDVSDKRYAVRLLPELVKQTGCFDVTVLENSQGLMIARKRDHHLSLRAHLILGAVNVANTAAAVVHRS